MTENRHGLDGAADDDRAQFDPVARPEHYLALGAVCPSCGQRVECVDVVRKMSYLVGAAVKYLWRLGLKDSSVDGRLQDLHKARQYVDFAIREQEGW
jgi:Protein of unknwon function (DUF3310)